MSSSWRRFWGRCKSRLSAIARSCFLTREHWRAKHRELQASLDQQDAALELNEQLTQENERLKARLAELEEKLAQSGAGAERPSLPEETPLAGHQYSAEMIELCINLARTIGLRPTFRALKIVFAWLRVERRIPSYQIIRTWMQRLALDRMQRAPQASDGIWLVDHTQQLGQDKALVVLRVRQSKLPPPGVALRYKDIEVLEVMPRKQWHIEDVGKVYNELAERYGMPVEIISDGASELTEAIKSLGKPGHQPLAMRDMKHFLAGSLEKLLADDEQYQQFRKRVGKMHRAVHQTELAEFEPPATKRKARYMNLEPLLNWAAAVLWHLEHPKSQTRQSLSQDTLEEKFGWLKDFRQEIGHWQQCLKVIAAANQFASQQGIFPNAAKQFGQLAEPLATCALSRKIVHMTVTFLQGQAEPLKPGQRFPMSTEILESCLARFKQLESQHSTEGFSGLLLSVATLLRPTTRKQIGASFRRVKVDDVKRWMKNNLPNTLTAKRQRMFREARRNKIGATPKLATT